jgi:hypothetical protein
LSPNAPPTWGWTTLIWDSLSPMVWARYSRSGWGFWVESHTVSRSASSSQAATMPRGSSGTPVVRPVRSEPLTTPSAAALAAATSPARRSRATRTFVPQSGSTSGAPGSRAASGSVTASSGSYSTSIWARASWAV